jgi:hypothetical protein
MADENIDLRFLAEQGKRILGELADMRGDLGEVRTEQKSLAEIVGKVANAVTAIAARQDHHTEILNRHSELLDKLYEIQQNNGARLNVIDGRLAIIERHTGLVKA